MGLGGVSLWQLAIVLGIVILLFGTKKLRNIGGDLGSAVKGFKKAMSDGVLSDEKEAGKDNKSIESKKDAEFADAAVKTEEQVSAVEQNVEKKS